MTCDQRFLSCMAFNIYKVVRITCYSHSFVFFLPGEKVLWWAAGGFRWACADRSFIIIEIMTQISSHERNHNAVASREKVSWGLCFAQQISLFDCLKSVIKPVNHVSISKILEVSQKHAHRKLHVHVALCRSFSHGINKPTSKWQVMQARSYC